MGRHGKIAVVMPAYNAERTLEKTFADIPVGSVDDVILVDDSSRDRTVEIARRLGLHVVVHPKNRGYGGNQKTCYRTALDRGADIVVMVHPDHQYDPRVIPAHREAAARLGYRAFLGVPVKLGERVTGVLSIRTRRPGGFSKEDETIATAFASQAATALENARLFRQVQVAAEEVSQAQEALLQVQKMEAVGRLAGGVAHDFNNLLTIIHGRCEILLKRFEQGSKPRKDLDLIQRTAQRAAALTKQLLAFSRQQVLQPRVLHVNAAVGESVSMLRRLIGEDITLVTLPNARHDRVKADPTQLE